MSVSAIRSRLLELGRWSVLLALAGVPFAKPATNIGLFLALLCALAGSDVRQRFAQAVREPVVLGCAAWFAVLLLSSLHAAGDSWPGELGSYKALLYPLVIASLMTTTAWRTRGLLAFAAAAGIILLMSWSQLFGLLDPPDITGTFEAYRYTVFNDYSQQGLQFLMLAAMAAAFACAEAQPNLRLLLWFIAAAALANVLFLLQSRTSYLTIAPLLLYWGWRFYVARGKSARLLWAGAAIIAVFVTAAAFSPRVQQRLAAAHDDISQYQQQHLATSLGIRLELWRRTLPIIASAPVFGHGLGAWRHEYDLQTRDIANFEKFRMGHPHQEALQILAEEGVAGFAIFLALLIALARHLHRLPQPQRDFFLCLLIIYISAGLANCLLIDFTHRHGFLLLLACLPLRNPALESRA